MSTGPDRPTGNNEQKFGPLGTNREYGQSPFMRALISNEAHNADKRGAKLMALNILTWNTHRERVYLLDIVSAFYSDPRKPTGGQIADWPSRLRARHGSASKFLNVYIHNLKDRYKSYDGYGILSDKDRAGMERFARNLLREVEQGLWDRKPSKREVDSAVESVAKASKSDPPAQSVPIDQPSNVVPFERDYRDYLSSPADAIIPKDDEDVISVKDMDNPDEQDER